MKESFESCLTQYIREKKIVVEDPKMKLLYHKIKNLSSYDTNLMIYGESGVGKNYYAYCIHEMSSRKNHPFLHINCGTIAPDLFESELFGYESGSFSGASLKGKKGLLETANHGTLFLDEIAELPPKNQIKLLQFLETGKIRRVGGKREISVDVRLISATNRDLHRMILEGDFREDLYYRLVTEEVTIPPLRERPADITGIIKQFCDQIKSRTNRTFAFSEEAVHFLHKQDWLGNLRELINILERSSALEDSDLITSKMLKKYNYSKIKKTNKLLTENKTGEIMPLKLAVKEFEKEYIIKVLKASKNHDEAAKKLGITMTTLYRKKKELHI